MKYLICILLVASTMACSLRNREGPDIECPTSDTTTYNACRAGIIGFCVADQAHWEVCDDEDICEAPWQISGSYVCKQGAAPHDVSPDSSPDATLGGLTLAAASLVSDTNTDGRLSPGESGRLRVEVRNTDLSTVAGIRGTLSTDAEGITIANPNLTFGTIPGMESRCGSTSDNFPGECGTFNDSRRPIVSVSTTVSPLASIRFSLSLTDGGGNALEPLSFDFQLAAIDQNFAPTSITLVSDTNNDQALSPGENGRLRIEIRNDGSSRATGIRGTLSTDTEGITIANPELSFGNIPSSETRCGSTSDSYPGECGSFNDARRPTISVATSVPPTTSIRLTLALTDTYDNAFEPIAFDYQLAPIAQQFAIESVTVVSDTNADGHLSPAESGRVRIEVRNSGSGTATGIRGTLSTNTEGVIVTNPDLFFGAIPAMETRCGSTSSNYPGECGSFNDERRPTITLAASVPTNASISLSLNLTDAYGNTQPVYFNYETGQ